MKITVEYLPDTGELSPTFEATGVELNDSCGPETFVALIITGVLNLISDELGCAGSTKNEFLQNELDLIKDMCFNEKIMQALKEQSPDWDERIVSFDSFSRYRGRWKR